MTRKQLSLVLTLVQRFESACRQEDGSVHAEEAKLIHEVRQILTTQKIK